MTERRKFLTPGKKDEPKSPYIEYGASNTLLRRYGYKDSSDVKEAVEHVFGKDNTREEKTKIS